MTENLRFAARPRSNQQSQHGRLNLAGSRYFISAAASCDELDRRMRSAAAAAIEIPLNFWVKVILLAVRRYVCGWRQPSRAETVKGQCSGDAPKLAEASRQPNPVKQASCSTLKRAIAITRCEKSARYQISGRPLLLYDPVNA